MESRRGERREGCRSLSGHGHAGEGAGTGAATPATSASPATARQRSGSRRSPGGVAGCAVRGIACIAAALLTLSAGQLTWHAAAGRHALRPADDVDLPLLPQDGSFLVTGAAGFIGMHIAQAVRMEGLPVIGLDCYTPYYSVGLKEARAARLEAIGVTVLNQSLCDEEAVFRLLQKHRISHIVHMAAQPGIELSLRHPQVYVRNNVECFTSLLQAASRATRIPSVVYASSSSVYGDVSPPFKEGQSLRPTNVYGATKAHMETVASVYARLHNLKLIGLRFFTVYGPMMRPDMAVYTFASKLVHNATVHVRGEHIARDFTYVDDVVDGVVRALRYFPIMRGDGADVFNIGSGTQHRVADMLLMLQKNLNRPDAPKVFGGHGKHEMPATGACLLKSNKLLGYVPRTNLTKGLREFTKWFLSEGHEWGVLHGDPRSLLPP